MFNGDFYISKKPNGTLLVANNQSPYICFEAASEEEALGILSRATDAYYAYKAQGIASTHRAPISVEPFNASGVLRSLEAAE